VRKPQRPVKKKLHPSEKPECPEQFRPGVGLIAEEMKKIYC